MADVVAAIQECVPGAEITWSGDPLPFPAELEAVGFDRDVGPVPAHAARRRRGGDDRSASGRSSAWTTRCSRACRRDGCRRVSASSTKNCAGEERRSEPEDGVEGSRRIPHGAEVERRGCPDRVAEAEHHRDEGADPGRRSLEVERQRHHHREQAALRDAGERARPRTRARAIGNEHDGAGDEAAR